MSYLFLSVEYTLRTGGERSLQSTIELRCIVTDLPQNELMPELHGFDLLRIRRSTVQQIEPVASEREPD